MLNSSQNGLKGGSNLWRKVMLSLNSDSFLKWKKNVSVYLCFGKYEVEIMYVVAYNGVFARGSVM